MTSSATARTGAAIRSRIVAKRAVRPAPRRGLLVFGGPPFGGRGPLAAMVAEWLPKCVKLETSEELSREHFATSSGGAARGATPVQAVVAAAIQRLETDRSVWTVVVAARFERPEQRFLAYQAAKEAGLEFLYVECISSNIRAIRRMLRLRAGADPVRHMALYDAAHRRYQPVRAAERGVLPHLRFRTVLADLDAAAASVLAAWHGPA
jgi:hypothetical protein